jgi:glycosyltransferase involved in cell wall biosynthesis
MIRVLQLLEQNADFQTRRLVSSLTAGLNGDLLSFATTIGPGGDLRGFWDAASWLAGERAEVIHAWGIRPLLAAAMFSDARIVYTPSTTTQGKSKWADWIGKRRDIQIVMHCAQSRTNRIPPHKLQLIPIGISTPPSFINRKVRAELGITADDFVVLAPGESTRQAEHHLALWTVAILHELHPSWKLLIWGRGELADEISRMAARLGRPRLVLTAREKEFEDLPSAADVALVTARDAAPLMATALCMAGGLPIVATNSWLADGRNALVVADRAPRTLAQRLLDLRNNAVLAKKLAESAQNDAAATWNMTRFLNRHQALYQGLRRPDSSLPGHVPQ